MRTIRITHLCEHGEPGTLLTPDMPDVANLLVLRGVAEYVEEAPSINSGQDKAAIVPETPTPALPIEPASEVFRPPNKAVKAERVHRKS